MDTATKSGRPAVGAAEDASQPDAAPGSMPRSAPGPSAEGSPVKATAPLSLPAPPAESAGGSEDRTSGSEEPASPGGDHGTAALATTQYGVDSLEDPWIGRTVDGRYRIQHRLAEGGMGMVFVAEHLTLHKQVALKVVRPELAQHEEVAARFAREALATAQFEHPHVVGAIDYGALPEGGAFLVMPLVRGQSLRRLLQEQQALPWRRACAIGAQIADALSAAHASGIVHRDLKPENVLVEPREDGSDLVKLLDFGIARIEPQQGQSPTQALPGQALTRVGVVMGTPGYMSPEQAVGGDLDHRADLYALGVVLWESVVGRELWTGSDFAVIVARQMADDAPALRQASGDPTLPEELEQWVQGLLARDAEQRPGRAAEVRDALRALSLTHLRGPRGELAFLNGLRARASAQMAQLSAAVPVSPRVAALTARLPAQWARLPRWGRSSAVLGLLALLCLPLVWARQGGDEGAAATRAAVDARQEDGQGYAAEEEQGSSPMGTSAGTPSDPQVTRQADARRSSSKGAGNTSPQAGRSAAQGGGKDSSQDGSSAHKVVQAVVRAAERALSSVGKTANEPPIPAALRSAAETLLNHRRLHMRRRAAQKILQHEPATEVPPYLRAVARLEANRTCEARQEALREIAALNDPQTRGSLERYYNSRSGCGLFNLQDCYGCIRPQIERILESLPAEPSPSTER